MSLAAGRQRASASAGDDDTSDEHNNLNINGQVAVANDNKYELYYSSPIAATNARNELGSSDSGECLDQDQSSGTTAMSARGDGQTTSYYKGKKSSTTIIAVNKQQVKKQQKQQKQKQLQHHKKSVTVINEHNYNGGTYHDANEGDDDEDADYVSDVYKAYPAAVATAVDHDDSAGSDIDGRSTRQALILIFFLIGLIICVGSLICILLLPTFVSNQIAKKLVLKNNSLLLERWSKPNVPMYFKVWLFNVKNAQELVDKRDTKPQVEQIGPFVFNLRRQKDVISFAGDNLYYTERRIYHFNRELSCCAINTTVTIPNIPLVAVVDRALGYNLPLLGRFIPRLINRAIQSLREQLFVRKQVNEILFDGYDVELLRMVSRIGSLVGLPQQSQRFALLKGRNDTWRPEQDGVWAINTGQRDRSKFGRVSSWNSFKKLPFWSAPQCNVINGSDGTLFPPPIKRTEPLYIFNQELCRTVNLVYDRPSDIRSIQAYRFVLNQLNFAHTIVPSSPASLRPTVALLQPGTTSSQLPAPLGPLSISAAAPASLAPLVGRVSPQLAITSGQPVAIPPIASTHNSRPGDLKPSASESNSIRTGAAAAVAPVTTAGTSIGSSSGSGNSNRQRQFAGPVLSQQDRLIRKAQEAQLSAELRAQSQINPQTCFCDRKTTNLNGVNVCEFDGLIDLSKCSKQAQVIFGSMPHFYNSDPRLLRQVDGLEPNASKHTTYLDIEPNTGLVLGGKRRVQLNVIIKHNNEIDGFENIKDMLVPIVWFEESALIPEESAQKFRSLYIDRVRLLNWSLLSLLIASIVLLLIDARLLITTRYWRQFKLIQVAGFNTGPNVNGISGSASEKSKENKKAMQRSKKANGIKPAATMSSASKKASGKFQPLGALVKFTSSCGGGSGGGDSNKIGAGLGACPLTRASASERRAGANLPLLNHNSSSYTSSSSASSSSSSSSEASARTSGLSGTRDSFSSSPPDSPELRKWSDDWNKRQQQQPTITRVYLSQLQAAQTASGHAISAPVSSEQDSGRPKQAANTTKYKSVVELSSPSGRQAISSPGATEVFDGATGGGGVTGTSTSDDDDARGDGGESDKNR